jgi:sphinganine-1-phosphate aldolase
MIAQQGWSLNSLQKPACLHLCLTLRTVGRTAEFLADLKQCVADVVVAAKSNPDSKDSDDSTAAMYGTAGSLPSGPLQAILTTYADVVLKA